MQFRDIDQTGDADTVRREELATFLRSRRERLSPAANGLPAGQRRRTPGLRREEVAQLAGIGTTWYTRLEQGVDIRASAGALEGIAQALHLNADERDHLFRLALQTPTAPPDLAIDVPRRVLTLIESLSPNPALVVAYNRDLLAWNAVASKVFVPFETFPPDQRNLLRIVFTHQPMRQRLVDWEEFAQGMLAQFRVAWGRHAGDRSMADLIAGLQRDSPEFREWWPRYELRGRPEQRKEIDHPELGRLSLEPSIYQIEDNQNIRIVVYTPVPNSDTQERLRTISVMP